MDSGKQLFPCLSREQVKEQLLGGHEPCRVPDMNARFPRTLRKLLTKCFAVKPGDRPAASAALATVQQVRAALR